IASRQRVLAMPDYVFSVFLIVFWVSLLWCMLMLYRNRLVFRWRLRLLEEDFGAYQRLPPYEVMVRRFWIWSIDGFKSKEGEK
ncbi:hypothetical protein NLN82_27325, partial [Citrobacter portucalensis]|uniref:hypothetical protein n=1 Tax=Citrobacter portucalensis TaxID=1639133 RepID=UPI00226B12CC